MNKQELKESAERYLTAETKYQKMMSDLDKNIMYDEPVMEEIEDKVVEAEREMVAALKEDIWEISDQQLTKDQLDEIHDKKPDKAVKLSFTLIKSL